MNRKDVGEIEEVKLVLIGIRDICLYIENCNIKDISQEVFSAFSVVLKEV